MTLLLHILAVLVCVGVLALLGVVLVAWRIEVQRMRERRTAHIHAISDAIQSQAQVLMDHMVIFCRMDERLRRLESGGQREREESMN